MYLVTETSESKLGITEESWKEVEKFLEHIPGASNLNVRCMIGSRDSVRYWIKINNNPVMDAIFRIEELENGALPWQDRYLIIHHFPTADEKYGYLWSLDFGNECEEFCGNTLLETIKKFLKFRKNALRVERQKQREKKLLLRNLRNSLAGEEYEYSDADYVEE